MATCYQVSWSKTAGQDLSAIVRFIQQTNPQAAVKMLAEIKEKTADLALFPERGRIVLELLAQGIAHYRELVIPPWRIIYRFSAETVYVLAVIDSRRNVEDVLLDRLIRSHYENPLS